MDRYNDLLKGEMKFNVFGMGIGENCMPHRTIDLNTDLRWGQVVSMPCSLKFIYHAMNEA